MDIPTSKQYSINMKNIVQWLDELPNDISEKAKRNCRLVPYKNGGTKVGSIKSALLHGFIWGSTDEGVNYWVDVFKGNYPSQIKLL